MVEGHVEVDDVAFFERSRVRDACGPRSSSQRENKIAERRRTVTDDLVDARADASREAVVAQGRRVGVSLDAGVVDDLVNLERRDARPDCRRRKVEDLSRQLSGSSGIRSRR